MNRRDVIGGLGALISIGRSALGAAASANLQLAILDEASPGTFEHLWKVFQKRLRELGYVEGKNLVTDIRYGGGETDRLATLAADLVSRRPDIICVTSTPAAQAIMRATT